MVWDSKSLEPTAELSPFVFARPSRRPERFSDPLAASIAFAVRGEDESFSGLGEERDTPRDSAIAATHLKAVADEAVKWGFLPAEVAASIKSGNRDEGDLTNRLFFLKHRELLPDHKITPAERALAREWLKLRTTVIRPVLQSPTNGIVVTPPFVKPADPGFTTDTNFIRCFKKVPLADKLRVALVDVTDPSKPVYAGFNDSITVFAASIPKVFAAYAAFELRARIGDALKTIPATLSREAALRAIKNAWQPQLDAKKPKDSAAFAGFPDLDKIFDITPTAGRWTVAFRSKGNLDDIAPSKREKADDAVLGAKFGFRENLELMTTYSNNVASAKVIAALTFEYINSLLVTAGLYEPGRGGLWLGSPYADGLGLGGQGDRWMAEPTMRETNGSRRFQVATARGLATLFTLLAQRRLVDPGSSDEILALLKTGINDSLRLDLEQDGRTVTDSRTKMGLLQEPNYYWGQASLIERKLAGKQAIRYVMVILNADMSVGSDKTFVLPMDDCVANRHQATPPHP